jgi:hypothetical protein
MSSLSSEQFVDGVIYSLDISSNYAVSRSHTDPDTKIKEIFINDPYNICTNESMKGDINIFEAKRPRALSKYLTPIKIKKVFAEQCLAVVKNRSLVVIGIKDYLKKDENEDDWNSCLTQIQGMIDRRNRKYVRDYIRQHFDEIPKGSRIYILKDNTVTHINPSTKKALNYRWRVDMKHLSKDDYMEELDNESEDDREEEDKFIAFEKKCREMNTRDMESAETAADVDIDELLDR